MTFTLQSAKQTGALPSLGFVRDDVRLLLRIEGMAVLAAACAAMRKRVRVGFFSQSCSSPQTFRFWPIMAAPLPGLLFIIASIPMLSLSLCSRQALFSILRSYLTPSSGLPIWGSTEPSDTA